MQAGEGLGSQSLPGQRFKNWKEQIMLSRRGKEEQQSSIKHTEETVAVFTSANTYVYIQDTVWAEDKFLFSRMQT